MRQNLTVSGGSDKLRALTTKIGGNPMLNSAKSFLREVIDLGLLLIAAAVILQVIFGQAVPLLVATLSETSSRLLVSLEMADLSA